MPVLVWRPNATGHFAKGRGRSVEVHVKDRVYTFAPGQGLYVEPTDVSAVTSKLTGSPSGIDPNSTLLADKAAR